MAQIGEGDKRYEGFAVHARVLTAERRDLPWRPWWHVWCWPVAVVAGVVFWLALVAIAGAATPCSDAAVARGSHAAQARMAGSASAAGRGPAASTLSPYRRLRTGFTPRRP